MLAASMAMFAINIDFFAVQATLPPMARDLDTTVTSLQWVISGYMLALASCLIVGGRLADIFGRRTFLMIGAAIFGLTSFGAGAASSPEMVIGMRIAQGVGAAILFPVCIAVVTNAFPSNRTQRAVGMVFGMAAIGQALGPLIGGVLTEALSWRWVLWVNVPIALAVIVLTHTSVAQSRDETVPHAVDWPGLVLVIASIASLTLGVDEGGQSGWDAPVTVGLMAAGIVGLVAFVVLETRVRFPLLDLDLFRIRRFSLITAGGTVGNMGIVTTIFASMIFLQDVEGLTTLEAGLVFLAFSLPLTVVDLYSGRLERFPAWAVMACALAVGGVGSVGMGLADGLLVFAAFAMLSGAGLGLSWAFASVATQAVVPAREAGAASGTVVTLLVGFGGVAIALAASFINTGVEVPSDLDAATQGVLVGFGALAVITAPVVVAIGRRIDARRADTDSSRAMGA